MSVNQTFSATDAVELAVVDRGGFIESRHIGAALVLDHNGDHALQYGNTDAHILPRSSLKPLQAIAALSAGAQLSDEELAIATASHAGTDQHVEVVRRILIRAGLTEDALQCPVAWPNDLSARDELSRSGFGPSAVRHMCSGKHAAMLMACVASGADPKNYLDVNHPFQVLVREVVERFTGEKVQFITTDGCGAPVPAVTITGLARAASRMGTANSKSPFALHRNAAELLSAARANGWAVEGTKRADTVAIDQLGVFAKSGAEGIHMMIAPNGATVVLKVLDGSGRVGTFVAAHLLAKIGAIDADAVATCAAELVPPVVGGGIPVGQIRLSAALR